MNNAACHLVHGINLAEDTWDFNSKVDCVNGYGCVPAPPPFSPSPSPPPVPVAASSRRLSISDKFRALLGVPALTAWRLKTW